MAEWLSVDEALSYLRAEVETVPITQRLKLADAVGRVLAEDQLARVDVPPADNSAMDGFACRMADLQSGRSFSVSQRIPAGHMPSPLVPGTFARIFTGAEIPAGADTVVIQEYCHYDREHEGVRLLEGAQVSKADFVRPKGESIRRGEVLLPKGARLRGPELGLLASSGIARVSVYRRLKVAILATGNELIEPGRALQRGQIYNASQAMLTGLLKGLDIDVLDLGCARDSVSEIEEYLARAADDADCIISVGGMSVGEEDHVKTALARLGQQAFWKIAIKPGKPLAYGRVDGVPFFGLPGNPVSSFMTFVLFVRPFLSAMQGQTFSKPPCYWMKAGFTVESVGTREEYLRARVEEQDGLSVAIPFENQSSGVLASICRSEVLVKVPIGLRVAPGDWVQVIPLELLC